MPKRDIPKGPEPWHQGDPTRKIGLNTPIDEPLMLMLDFLVENKAIFSKAQFIREAVTKAAQAEIAHLYKVREAVKRLDLEEKAR